MKTSEASVDDDKDERLDEDARGDDNAEGRESEKVWIIRAVGKVVCVRCGRLAQGQFVHWSQELNGPYHLDCQNMNLEFSGQDRLWVSLEEIAAKVSAGHDESMTPVLARQPEETPSTPQKSLGHKGPSPADRAEEYLTGRDYETAAGLHLRKHRGQWLRYTGKYYEVLTQETLEVDITNYFIKTAYRNTANKAFVSGVIQQLTARCLIPNTVELPVREVKGQWTTESRTVTVTNGTINMEAVHRGVVPKLDAHTSQLVSRCLLPYEYLSSAQCPAWLVFLEEILPDQGSRRLLQQIFGYCLTHDLSLQRFFMFEGTGGNGKGVVTNILIRLVGRENISGLPLNRFHDKHDLVVTHGKLVNITSELGEKDRISEEQLKLATGGDLMHFNPKYQEIFSAKFTAKIIISTNERPSLGDRSEGIWRRLILLFFPITIPPERQNPRLEESLAGELPGILNWAIQGAISLYRKGKFEEPQQSIDARLNYKKESNPAQLFLDQRCELKATAVVGTVALYGEYQDYCSTHGYKALNETNFKKEVLKLPGVTKDRAPNTGDHRPHIYCGIALSDRPPSPALGS